MSKLFGSICVSDIPQELVRTANNGKRYISVEVCERREPDRYGETHYVKAWSKAADRKEGVNYFIGELGPSKYDQPSPAQQQPQPQQAAPTTKPAAQPYAPAEQTITYVDDVPF